MLSINILLIDDKGGSAIAHIQIKNRADHKDRPEFGNYRWIIEEDGATVEGELDNFERSKGALELVWQVLSIWMIGKENTKMTRDWFQAMLVISEDEE